MLSGKSGRVLTLGLVGLVVVLAYLIGQSSGDRTGSSMLMPETRADTSSSDAAGAGWSPTKRYPNHEVYFPGTEELGADKMRVIACGSGMPMPRSKQAAACFLIERGALQSEDYGFTPMDT